MSPPTYLLLDTRDAIDPSNPFNAVWSNLSLFHDHVFNRIALHSIVFSNLVYPVNTTTNTLVFEEDGVATDLTATLSEGAYTATEFATELKTQLDAEGSNTYTVTYDTNTRKYTISTSGTSLRITSDSTALELIGLVEGGMSAFASSKTSDVPIRLDGPQFVDVITNFGYSRNVTSNNRRIFSRLPLTVPFGSLFSYTDPYETYVQFNSKQLTNFEIRLQDDKGNDYALPESAQISYVFKLTHVE